MRRSFLKIAAVSAAATLALTLGVSSAVADNAETSAAANTVTIIDKQMMTANNEYDDAYNKAFEEALNEEAAKINNDITVSDYEADCLQRGVEIEDPHKIARENAKKTAEEKSSALKSLNETNIFLYLVGNSAYNHWIGTYYIDSVEETRLSFHEPDSFNLTLGNTSARMTAKNGYEGNYKKCTVTLYFTNGQKSTNTVTSNKSAFAVKADSKGPTIRRADFEFSLYDGTGSNSKLMDVANVSLYRVE